MNRNRKIGILLGVFLCISLAAIGVSRYEERKEMIKNSDEVILEVSGEEVKTLSWECDTGSFAFHRDGDSRWIYDEDEAFPVDQDKIGKLLEQFQEFGVSFIIEEVEDWAQYGLDQPICTIHMETESETYEILLGGYSAMDSERYVSIGDGSAYLVKEDPLAQFSVEIRNLIKHDDVPALQDVTQVQFSGERSGRIIYEEDSASTYCTEDVYFMEQGKEYLPLDTSNVNAYLGTIKNLNLMDYVDYNASEDDMAIYGLDKPELSVVISYTTAGEETGKETEEAFVLNVGRDPAERKEASAEDGGEDAGEDVTAYARVGESRIIYRLPADQYKKLMDMSYDSLRHQEIFWADFADMYQLDILLEGSTYTITSSEGEDGRTYYYREEELEMAGIRSAIRNLKAVSFTDETPSQKEEISLTIYLDNENYPEVPIQLYRYDGSECIAVVDGEPAAFVERACVVDFIEAVNAIVLE